MIYLQINLHIGDILLFLISIPIDFYLYLSGLFSYKFPTYFFFEIIINGCNTFSYCRF